MPVVINLNNILKEKLMTSKELCDLVGITEANMSILRSGRARAIRFDTLSKLCYFLDCSPGDILKYEKKEEDKNNEVEN